MNSRLIETPQLLDFRAVVVLVQKLKDYSVRKCGTICSAS